MEVLYLHHRIVEQSGGSHGVRDIGLLDSALQRPFGGINEDQFFVTIPEKIASILDSIVRNHPFVDGNKRTGMSIAVLTLEMNGYRFLASHTEFVEYAVQLANERPTVSSIADWLIVHSEPASPH